MTNEEKAKEIAGNFFIDEDVELNMTGEECHISCTNAALDMAEWKDAQFKEYLEKKREKIKRGINKCSFNSFTEYFIAKKMDLLDEIINEFGGE